MSANRLLRHEVSRSLRFVLTRWYAGLVWFLNTATSSLRNFVCFLNLLSAETPRKIIQFCSGQKFQFFFKNKGFKKQGVVNSSAYIIRAGELHLPCLQWSFALSGGRWWSRLLQGRHFAADDHCNHICSTWRTQLYYRILWIIRENIMTYRRKRKQNWKDRA